MGNLSPSIIFDAVGFAFMEAYGIEAVELQLDGFNLRIWEDGFVERIPECELYRFSVGVREAVKTAEQYLN